MSIRFALLACTLFASHSYAENCESTFHEKSSVTEQIPHFDHGALIFVVQPLFKDEIDKIEESWKTRLPGPDSDRSTDFMKANKQALSELDLGRSSVINPSLNGPQAVLSVPNEVEFCTLIKQRRVVLIWPERAMVAPKLAPLSSGDRLHDLVPEK